MTRPSLSPTRALSPERRAPILLLAALTLTLGACDKGNTPPPTDPDTATPTPTSEAPTDGPAEDAGSDLDFNCTVDAAALGPWPATGMDVSPELRDQFQLWMSMETSDVPEALQASCEDPPASGDYSPVQGPDKGNVSRGDFVVATQAVTIYRAYTAEPFECSSSSPAAKFGSWWSLTPPTSPKQSYRDSVNICSAWNDLSMVTTCTLKAGTVALVGPSQSIDCSGQSSCESPPKGWSETLAATTSPQLFISTYAGGEKRSDEQLERFLLDCTTAPWAD